ncbi:MAG: sugar kinase [Bacillaceae bacterium]|nr:sugar kinase [Bacillaceae bacterium]
MDVVTIGETMAVFTPEQNGMLRHARTFSMTFAGAESNVAIGLSRLGHRTRWISRVGTDEFGEAMVSFIRGEGVDVDFVKRDSLFPTGVFFKELRRPDDVRVYYYRKDSAASHLTIEDIDERAVTGARYLHLTGITPALSASCHEVVKYAIELARRNNIKVVFDPNLRMKLWGDKQVHNVMKDLMAQADIVLPGLAEGRFLFQEADPGKLAEHFHEWGVPLVVIKLGKEGAFYSVKDGERQLVPGTRVSHVVDPIGAGDGFAAGFLSGLLNDLPLYQAVQKGNTVGAMVTQVSGDVEGLPDQEDLEQFSKEKQDDVMR